MKKNLAMLFCLVLFSGCTYFNSSAGPFVTNISSDGKGNLIIEKSTVKFNDLSNTVYNDNVSTTTIKVVDVPTK